MVHAPLAAAKPRSAPQSFHHSPAIALRHSIRFPRACGHKVHLLTFNTPSHLPLHIHAWIATASHSLPHRLSIDSYPTAPYRIILQLHQITSYRENGRPWKPRPFGCSVSLCWRRSMGRVSGKLSFLLLCLKVSRTWRADHAPRSISTPINSHSAASRRWRKRTWCSQRMAQGWVSRRSGLRIMRIGRRGHLSRLGMRRKMEGIRRRRRLGVHHGPPAAKMSSLAELRSCRVNY